MNVVHKKLPAKVGQMSLIGVGGDPPYSWGNYFWLATKGPCDSSPRVANMWAENLQALVEDGTIADGLIEVREYTHNDRTWCLIIDSRVPKSYLYNNLNFTGYYKPPYDILEDMYNTLDSWSWQSYEFIDPATYYPAIGGAYDPRGYVTYRMRGDPDRMNHVKLDYDFNTLGI